MKSKNILHDIKSKSLKEVKNEINDILSKLEKKDIDLKAFSNDYQRLIQLNNLIDTIFKQKAKNISSSTNKKIKK